MLKLTATGRLGKDAEQKYTPNGKAVLSFSVGTDAGWGDKKHTVWLECAVWGDRGEKLAPYLLKGTPVTVIGTMDLREWESNGKSGTSLELKVSELVLQGGKNTQSGNDRAQSGNATPEKHSYRQPENQSQPDFADDDIPF